VNRQVQQQMIEAACQVRAAAYAPYSRFLVGAAILTADRQLVTGCNVENASYGLTLCAERVALCAAVAAGHRQFLGLAIASSVGCPPCGACRQVLAEFCPDLPIYLVAVDAGRRVTRTTLAKLFPGRFDL